MELALQRLRKEEQSGLESKLTMMRCNFSFVVEVIKTVSLYFQNKQYLYSFIYFHRVKDQPVQFMRKDLTSMMLESCVVHGEMNLILRLAR
jgi:hypothetical protein